MGRQQTRRFSILGACGKTSWKRKALVVDDMPDRGFALDEAANGAGALYTLRPFSKEEIQKALVAAQLS